MVAFSLFETQLAIPNQILESSSLTIVPTFVAASSHPYSIIDAPGQVLTTGIKLCFVRGRSVIG
jgi:hypothetical protein